MTLALWAGHTLAARCDPTAGARPPNSPRATAGHFFGPWVPGPGTFLCRPSVCPGGLAPQGDTGPATGETWSYRARMRARMRVPTVSRMVGHIPSVDTAGRPLIGPAGPVPGPPGTARPVTRVSGIDRPRIAAHGTGVGRFRGLLQGVQFTLTQVIFPFTPRPFPPLALKVLPVGLKAVELVQDRVWIVLRRALGLAESRHLHLLHMCRIRGRGTVTEMHASLAVGPAVQ